MTRPSFTLAEITPTILETIRERSQGLVVSHDELVSALLVSKKGSALVAAAADVLKKSVQATAAIMIAQFSKQFTDAKPLPDDIRRDLCKGVWQYKAVPKDSSPFFPFDKMMEAMDEAVAEDDAKEQEAKLSLPLWERRQNAVARLMEGRDFVKVAKENSISLRTLLAWRKHEYGKWMNDPDEGREPGPSDDYQGTWPSDSEEMEAYAELKLNPNRIDDDALRERYVAFLSSQQTAGRTSAQ